MRCDFDYSVHMVGGMLLTGVLDIESGGYLWLTDSVSIIEQVAASQTDI